MVMASIVLDNLFENHELFYVIMEPVVVLDKMTKQEP